MSKKSEQIEIYNQFKNIIKVGIRNSSNNIFKPIKCFLIDNEWLNLWKEYIGYKSSKEKNISKLKKPNQNQHDNIKPCKALNNYEEVKNYIQNNKSFEIVNEEFINSIDSFFKKKVQLSMKILYIGLSKLIICFKEGENDKYLLKLIGKKHKYYEFFVNDSTIFNKILTEKYENFKKNTKLKNIRFNLLNNSNSTAYSQDPKNSFNIGNNYIYNYNSSNQRNISINNNIENDIPEEENNTNINRNEGNNIPYNIKSSTNNKAQDINKGTNITNSKNSHNENINSNNNNDNILNKTRKEEEEKKNYYENEKQRLLLQKKINESLLLDLDKANKLAKLRKSKAKVEEDIEKTKKDLENIELVIKRLKKEIELSRPKEIVKEEKINGRAPRRNKSYKSQIKHEQMMKREELDYIYRMLKLEDKIKDLEKKKYIKQLYEEKLKQRENDLIVINEKIRQQYEFEKDFNKKQEFIKVMLEQNEEELEKLNKINNYEEELKKVQKEIKEKEKRKREEEIIKEEQEKAEKERKEREEFIRRQKEEELNRLKYIEEEELNKKKLEEENKIKMMEEEQKKKQEDYLDTIRKQQKESEEQVIRQNERAKLQRLEEQINTNREEEKRRQKELEEFERKRKELEELEKQNRIKMEKERELEEQRRKQVELEEQRKKQIELEEQKRRKELEEQERRKKEFEEKQRKQKELEEEQRRKKKELEEQQRKQKEFEEKRSKQEEQIRIQEELERKKRELEEEKRKQKELEEQRRKQKELEEQQRRQKELEEQQKRQKELEEQQRRQKELEEQQKMQNKLPLCCKSFKIPPLIGLENIGSTCYMNATLQCFSQTEVLTNYFLNEKNIIKIMNNNVAKKDPNDLQLSPSYYNLIHNLWSNKPDKWFSPQEFRIKLAKMNPLFKEGLPNDAKDLVTFILMQLHSELNLKDGNNNINNNIDYNIQNQYNEQVTLNNFIQSFFSENSSVLSDHFFGVQESKFLCTGCQKRAMGKGLTPIKYNFQTFNFLIFPLEEVRIHRNKKLKSMNPFNMNNPMNMNQFNMNNPMNMNQFNMNNPMNMNQFNMNNQMNMNQFNMNNNLMNINQNVVTIYDCFDYFQKEEFFTGENAMWCNDCNALLPSRNQTFIYTGPNILILILNRGVGIQFKIKLNYYESIDLNKYILKKDRDSMIYDLYGVVTHIGESGGGGHFIAACKSPCNNQWYRYNDALINQITNLQKEVIDFGNSYILFYQKK